MSSETRTLLLKPNHEFRFEVSYDASLELTVVEGNEVEIFGCELAPGRLYLFSGCKSSVFTFSGCKLALKGETLSEYVSAETVVPFFLNLHYALQSKSSPLGSRVLILGPGRNSLSRTLLNYSVRQGHSPMWVDLDAFNGSMVFPGVIGALPMDKGPILPSGEINLLGALCYFYGLVSSSSERSDVKTPAVEDSKYYRLLLESMSRMVNQRMSKDTSPEKSGIIATGPYIESSPVSYEILDCIFKSFQIDTLLVIGNEKLFNDLEKRYPVISCMRVRQSSGLVAKDWQFRKASSQQKISKYFNGGGGLGLAPLEGPSLHPFPLVVSFNDLHIRKVNLGSTPMAPISALPIGSTRRAEGDLRLSRVELISSLHASAAQPPPNTIYIQPMALIHSVLGLSSSDIDQEATVLDSPVLGFVVVTDVNETKSRVTLLVPSPGKLPKPFLIWAPNCPFLKFSQH